MIIEIAVEIVGFILQRFDQLFPPLQFPDPIRSLVGEIVGDQFRVVCQDGVKRHPDTPSIRMSSVPMDSILTH